MYFNRCDWRITGCYANEYNVVVLLSGNTELLSFNLTDAMDAKYRRSHHFERLAGIAINNISLIFLPKTLPNVFLEILYYSLHTSLVGDIS